MGIAPIDSTGASLCSAIIWADQRATEEAEAIARYADIYPLFQDTYRGLEPIYARISEP